MLSDKFLDLSFSTILNKNSNQSRNKTLYRDLLDILKFYQKKEKDDIPVTIQNKLECLIKVCELKLINNRTDDTIIDSITISNKFKNLEDYLDVKMNESISDEEIFHNIEQIKLRKKLTQVFSNYKTLEQVVTRLKDGSYNSLDDIVVDYENVIKELFINVMESNRLETVQSASSLDVSKDDMTHITQSILERYERKNVTPTGYDKLDNYVLNGGFEKSRLYIFGGGSGSGKSTLLQNFIIKPILKNLNTQSDKKKIYIYITLENTLEESLVRFYQILFDKDSKAALKDAMDATYFKDNFKIELEKNNTKILMYYFSPFSISPMDLSNLLDSIKTEYKDDEIMGLYIDYLDQLRSDMKYDIYRLELGHVTVSLKTLAVQYNFPVITGTQLNKSAYRVQDAQSLNIDQVSESMKKVDNADFIGLLMRNSTDESMVFFKVAKNRNGKSNVSLVFSTDFSKFKFINCSLETIQDNKKPNNYMDFSSSDFKENDLTISYNPSIDGF